MGNAAAIRDAIGGTSDRERSPCLSKAFCGLMARVCYLINEQQ